MKTEFVAHASHELRTPLTSLVGYANMLGVRRRDMTPEMLDNALEVMQRQGDRVSMLIQNLLDLSQLEGPTLTLEPVPLATAARRALRAAPPPDGRIVDVSIPDDIQVLANTTRLDQVITNLLVNAYRYGGPSISIDALVSPHATRLLVTDDGEGVPEPLAPRLFEPFARGPNVGGTIGSGLGLAITKRIVEACGGTIGYEHADPKGARFSVTLRCA